MREEIIFAGFGGQGVILAGKVLCIAAMNSGKQVSHIPSYGAEMRGGTANCSVIVSDDEIASPVVYHPTILVVLNGPSLRKFEPRLARGGLILYNSSLIAEAPKRADAEAHAFPANELAAAEGNLKAVNMAALGFLLRFRPALAPMAALIEALDDAVSSRNRKWNEINRIIIEAGLRHQG